MRTDYSSGKAATSINAINTVMQHLNRMYTNSQPSSGPGTFISPTGLTGIAERGLGMQGARSLKVDSNAVATELAKAYTGGAITLAEEEHWNNLVDPDGVGMTTGKLQQNIKEVATLLQGKMVAFSNQWDKAMPHRSDGAPVSKPMPIVDNEAQEAFRNLTGTTINEDGRVTKAFTPPSYFNSPAGAATVYTTDGKTFHYVKDGSLYIPGAK
jgi:hypothetical protein